MIKKGDVILVLLIVFGLSVSFIINNGSSTKSMSSWSNMNNSSLDDVIAIIKKDDKIIRLINLSQLTKREVITIQGRYKQTVAADPDRICFLSADCSDGLCVKEGWLDKPGQLAVCLQNRTMLKVVRKSDIIQEGIEK